MRRASINTVLVALALSVAACAVRRGPPAEPPPGPTGSQQEDRGGALQYVLCSDCRKPTPKTLPRAASVSAVRAEPPKTVDLGGLARSKAAAGARTQTERFTLFFEPGSSAMSAASARALVEAAPRMRAAATVRVVAFTDNLGSPQLNDRLAAERAREVLDRVRTLVGEAAGLEGPRLSAVGKPLCCYVADNASEAGRAANRRAELLIELPAGGLPDLHATRTPSQNEGQQP